MRMTAFGEQEKIVASMSDGLSDHLLAAVITLGRVDDIYAQVESLVQEGGGRFVRDVLVSNFRAAEAENGYIHVCFAESTFFHGPSVMQPRIRRMQTDK